MLGADDYVSKPLDAGGAHGARQAVAYVAQCNTPTGTARREASAERDGLRTRASAHASAEILSLLADGRTQGQIATELVISPKTVATHIQQHPVQARRSHQGAGSRARASDAPQSIRDVRAHALALLATPG